MPLYRKHRGQLTDSLATTIIVKNMLDLRCAILDSWELWLGNRRPDGSVLAGIEDFEIQIKPCLFDDNGFPKLDTRCGWYTHYVSADIMERGVFCVEGMLSEPMHDYKERE